MKYALTLLTCVLGIDLFGQIEIEGFHEVYRNDSTAFLVSESESSWWESVIQASEINGHLATFSSLEENDVLANAVEQYEGFWIGLSQNENGDEPAGGWEWVTGEDLLWTGWGTNEPSDSGGDEDCAELGAYPSERWNDRPCGYTQKFLVEVDLPELAIPEYIPTDGLMAWYPMNGNALDESGNGFNCQSVGATLTEDRFGIPSSAYTFDGQGSRLQGASLPFSDLSISIWFKPDAGILESYGGGTPPTGAQLIGQGTSHSPCRYCDWAIGVSDWYDGTDQLAWEKANVSSCQVQQSAATWNPEIGVWTHLMAVSEGSNVTFYINGSWVSTIPFEEPLQHGGSVFSIGARYVENCNGGGSCTGPDNAWSGAIDDVAIWNRALTPEEILALYDAPAPTFGCLDASACNYNSGADLSDDSCLYLDECGECGGQGVLGCMDINACNFDGAATCPSDGCIYFPVVELGEDLIICEEFVVLAAGSEELSYLWSNGETTPEIDVTQSGVYSVEVSVSSGLPAEAAVIGGFQYIGSLEQSHYYVSEASILWEEAKINCELIGGHLVTISSEEENELVWQGVYANGLNPGGSNNYQAWIGLYQNFDAPDYSEPAGGWEWVTGEPVEYSNWGPTEPNNTDQGYFVHMTDANGACPEGDDICGTWDDANISGNLQSAFYVLELPIESSLCSSSDSVFVDFNHGSCFCGTNAVWDESLGECMGVISPSNACGLGTYWDEEVQECIITVPSDTDFDGCVGMIDLLDLLSVFGTCNETPWSCGEPLEYQGYDYETVQIGGQCWFAENLRSENYLNGDAILSSLPGDEWSTVNVGAVATFGEGESNCYNYSPNGNACNESWALGEYGRLYNWHTTVDDRGLCPTDWHVSSDSDWLLLTEFLGGSFEAEMAMKTTTGWSNSGHGSNSSGFSGLPGGQRSNNLGNFNLSGTHGYWWSSSIEGMDAVGYYLSNLNEGLIRITEDPRYGSSVRCIHDSE